MDHKTFSAEQKAGQRLMVGFNGNRFNSDIAFLIDTLKVGGIILFSRNISDPRQVRDLCGTVQTYAKSCGQPPLLIAVDQEGGKVARLKKPFTEFSGNPHMQGVEEAVHFAGITAKELASVGINMNMAPVLDVAMSGPEGIMKDRAFGENHAWVTELGLAVIEGLQAGGIMSVAKHFPGIGRTRLDSHQHLPFLETKQEVLESSDFLPFEAAIRQGVAGIMLSHINYKQLDEEWPASLSRKIARDLLRRRMKYQGVVITDDLDMGAVAKHFEIKIVIHRLLEAEIDIILICHKGPAIENAFEEILRIARDNPETNAAADRSLGRIMKLKSDYLNGC